MRSPSPQPSFLLHTLSVPTITDFLLQSASGVTAPVVGVWVRFVNNSTLAAFVSNTATDAVGTFTIAAVPPGTYTVSTGPSAIGGWTVTTDTNYFVGADVGSSNTFTGALTVQGVLTASSDASIAGNASVTGNAVLHGPGPWFDVKAFGATGNGGTDDTVSIQNTINAANSTGGGTVYFPAGTYVAAGLNFFGKIQYRGAGIENTILLLKNGSNTFLLQSNSFTTLAAGGGGAGPGTSTGGEANYSFSHMTLDGNKANNGSSTVPVWRQYGFGFELGPGFRCRNGNNDNYYSEWSTSLPSPGNDSMMAFIYGLKSHDAGKVGVHWNGPHDSQWAMGEVYNNGATGSGTTGCGVFADTKGSGLIMMGVHSWGLTQTYAAYALATGCGFSACNLEGAITAQVALDANDCWISGGFIYGAGASVPVGIVVGTTGARSQLRVDTKVENCTSGALVLTNDGAAGNSYDLLVFQSGGTLTSGALNAQSTLKINASGVTGNIMRFTGGISPGTELGANQAGQIFQGSGVPNNANGNNGDFYFRTGTPGTANQRIYQRSAGAWVALTV